MPEQIRAKAVTFDLYSSTQLKHTSTQEKWHAIKAVVGSAATKGYQPSVRLLPTRISQCLITRGKETRNMQLKRKNVRRLESRISNVYEAFKITYPGNIYSAGSSQFHLCCQWGLSRGSSPRMAVYQGDWISSLPI